jgi:hypothetical protein
VAESDWIEVNPDPESESDPAGVGAGAVGSEVAVGKPFLGCEGPSRRPRLSTKAPNNEEASDLLALEVMIYCGFMYPPLSMKLTSFIAHQFLLKYRFHYFAPYFAYYIPISAYYLAF